MTISIRSARQAIASMRSTTDQPYSLWSCSIAVLCSAVMVNMAVVPTALATEFSLEDVALEEIALEEAALEEVVSEGTADIAVLIVEKDIAEKSLLGEFESAQISLKEVTFEDVGEVRLGDAAGTFDVSSPHPQPFSRGRRELEMASFSLDLNEAVLEETVLEETVLEETAPEQFFLPEEQFNLTEETLNESVGVETVSASLQEVAPASLQSTQSLLLSQFDVDVDEINAVPEFGTAGTQRWYLQSAVGVDFDDDAVGLVGAGVTHFFYDYHSLSLELNGLYFDQPGDNAAGLNLNLLLRSHWIRGDNWSIYVDGGAGILQSTDGVPSVGSTFNFTPQIGAGATFALNDDNQRLMMGMRWHHTSSANTFRPNPGLDVLLGYVGINFPL